MSIKNTIRHAFMIEDPEAIEPTEYQVEIVDKVCKGVVKRRMTVPALMALEMSRPLNFLASQAIHFFRPIVSVVLDTAGIEAFANFLEHRGAVEYLARRLDYWEDRGIGDEVEDVDSSSPLEKDVLPKDAATDDDNDRS